jgi:hypothetical protein
MMSSTKTFPKRVMIDIVVAVFRSSLSCPSMRRNPTCSLLLFSGAMEDYNKDRRPGFSGQSNKLYMHKC